MTDELTEEQQELVAAARQARAAEIAAEAVAYLDDAIQSAVADWPQGDLILGILKSLILNACGCICTPARRDGGPATHAEDILCPVHGSGEYASSPLPNRPVVRRIWRSRNVDSGGAVIFESLAALDEFVDTNASTDTEHTTETAWRVTFDGVMVVSSWKQIRSHTPPVES